ncbi:hypothetical protein RNAN_0310 [Rheinheimera nanhaiensis E407-8]|uniref:Uncharacterized protein n=1 Tax=Rheinheimera nanhaiensis E407-8 TaxID=562729 RepID=I1DTG9_9GAMM|nr:hypothetical protein RNAN_0310 [Rheinheimera nanhaiensis E407-8]
MAGQNIIDATVPKILAVSLLLSRPMTKIANPTKTKTIANPYNSHAAELFSLIASSITSFAVRFSFKSNNTELPFVYNALAFYLVRNSVTAKRLLSNTIHLIFGITDANRFCLFMEQLIYRHFSRDYLF